MSQILVLPGTGCRYWTAGFCLYPEALNPGLEQGFRCLVLRKLEDSLDALIDRGEKQNLSIENTGRIWRQRLVRDLGETWDCPDFIPVEDEFGGMWCARLEGDLCHLRLPPCPGRCRRYAAMPPERYEGREEKDE